MQRSVLYTLGFATLICLVCSVMVAASAVSLKGRQEANLLLDRQKNVLLACGLIEPGKKVARNEILAIFKEYIRPKVIDLKTGEESKDVDPASYDQRRAVADPEQSYAAPAGNFAQVKRLPKLALVYEVIKDGKQEMIVLPIEGKGLWSTLYGYLALDMDATTVRGVTYYQHAETPGLGGEVDNLKWKAQWQGRKVYDEKGAVKLHVIKGKAEAPGQDPYSLDGLSGATITSKGVTFMLDLWLGENGFGPYLAKVRPSLGAPASLPAAPRST